MSTTQASPQCDLVMKGGITSGVVYPKLIAELAGKYRFKNIGGTSAGAIAAAACAAAEFGRVSQNNPNGFAELSRLPTLLGEKTRQPGQSMLFRLFQPATSVAKHFAVLVSMLNKPPLTAIGHAMLAMVRQFWAMVLLGLVLALLMFAPIVLMASPAAGGAVVFWIALVIVGLWWLWAAFGLRRLAALKASPMLAPTLWWAGGLAATATVLWFAVQAHSGARLWVATLAAGIAAPLTIGLVVALSGLRFAVTLVHGMHANGYGMCSGRTAHANPAGPPGLTDWLSRYLDDLAGITGERPLTFGDLWGAPFDGRRFADLPAAERQINLQVMTTAVSQQLCFSIPFRGDQTLYYDPVEWARLFPERVIQWINEVSAAEGQAAAAAGTHAERVVFGDGPAQRALSRLPGNVNLPVVVAVRMSLSFPALLSAVPLYAVDFTRKLNRRPDVQTPVASVPFSLHATRIWFSDGGIASNMPLHFFDSPLPRHPTFAVNLKDEHPDYKIDPERKAADQAGRVYLPENNVGGRLRYWPAPEDDTAVAGLIGFLSNIVHTMQTWRDEIQFPYPGYRDRIVQISQLEDEGGLNLDMPSANIERLSDAGAYAAQRLIARFYPPDAPVSEGWKNHKEVRLRTFLGVLEHMVLALQPRLSSGSWGAVVDGISSSTYSEDDKQLARQCLDRVEQLAALLKDSHDSLEAEAPRPVASMQIAPRI
jgi:predicted acylesterase/phospholipase RssA